jgi:hypothetical protein
MPRRRATARAVVRLSPVSMTTRIFSRAQRLKRRRRRRLHRVGDGEDAGGAAVEREEDRRRAVRRCRSASPSSAAVSTPCSPRKPRCPAPACGPRPCRPRPCRSANRSPRPRPGRAALGRRGDDGQRQRMLARRSTLAASRSTSASSKPVAGTIAPPWACPRSACRSCRPPACRPFQALQRLGVLDQHAGLGAAADADHDRHRRGEAERAGTGDDQHRDRGDQAEGEPRLGPPDRPGGEGERARWR